MRFRFIATIAALAAGLALAGCTPPPVDSKAGPGGSGVAAESGAKPASPDDKIKEDVKKAFAADPELSKESIEIEVKDGQVKLKGTVSTSAIKMRAEDTARQAPEVFSVDTSDLFAK